MRRHDIELFSKTLAKTEVFEFSHAERVLQDAEARLKKNPKQVTWELPENSKYEFVDGKLIARENQGTNKGPSKKRTDRASDKARE